MGLYTSEHTDGESSGCEKDRGHHSLRENVRTYVSYSTTADRQKRSENCHV